MALNEKMFDANWNEITRNTHKNTDYHFKVVIGKTKKDDVINRRLAFRIKQDFAERLGWFLGDKICVYHHPDNVFLLKLIKSDSGNGFKLSKNNEVGWYFISITWKNPKNITLEGIESHVPDYKIYKGALIVDINE